MSVFREYAHFYDIYYADKNYAEEAGFVLKLADMFGKNPKSLLDMACGTGKHLDEFIKKKLQCDGFDLSDEMLEQAKIHLSGKKVDLSRANITSFRNGKEYDLVVSMFAAMCYLTSNEQMVAGFTTARKHLHPEGLFIFDGWFGPAVLTQKPEIREHRYKNGENDIIRKVVPNLDVVKQIVTVNYEIDVCRDQKIIKQTHETHVMRFLFVQEVSMAMDAAGLELLHCCPFMKPDEKVTEEDWNVSFVARRK